MALAGMTAVAPATAGPRTKCRRLIVSLMLTPPPCGWSPADRRAVLAVVRARAVDAVDRRAVVMRPRWLRAGLAREVDGLVAAGGEIAAPGRPDLVADGRQL